MFKFGVGVGKKIVHGGQNRGTYLLTLKEGISTLWWPNIWPKMEFPEFKKKQKNKKTLAHCISYLAFNFSGCAAWPYSFLCSYHQLQLCGA